VARKYHLAELQLAIMHVLWKQGEVTVSQVRDTLKPKRSLAYTTVGTMLAKMEEKGHVKHRSDGRANVYRAAIREDQVQRSMVTDLADRLFQGDVAQMVCHLLDSRDMTSEDLAEMRRLIRQKEQELQDE
jgi:predicted transcriptional regulator